MHIKELILLKKLGLTVHPLDYVLHETEGAALYFLEKDSMTFRLKTLTNQFTPGLFQYICAACATMGMGTLTLEVDEPALGSLMQVFQESELRKVAYSLQADQPYKYAKIEKVRAGVVRAHIFFNYAEYPQAPGELDLMFHHKVKG